MKVIATVNVSHPALDVSTLLMVLPMAFDSVRACLSAGVAATGPDGMTIQAPGTSALIKVHFNLAYEEPEPRLTVMVAESAAEASDVPR